MGQYRCEAKTTTGNRCRCEATEIHQVGGFKFLICKRHRASLRQGLPVAPAVKVSQCPPPTI